MNDARLGRRALELAQSLGFDDAGVAPVELAAEAEHLDTWLAAGYAASMDWIERGRDVRLDLRRRFPWARSVLVVTRRYAPAAEISPRGLMRYVSNYAWGSDYHDILLPRLRQLGEQLTMQAGADGMQWHAYVDTGPAMERQLARAAGLGWLGKNALLLTGSGGSYVFLGALIVDKDLSSTRSPAPGSCGRCEACQPACPTGAFVRPGVVDSRRCISYLTIEHKGPIDRQLRRGMGEWLFGCDLCQTACPFNVRGEEGREPAFQPATAVTDLDLTQLLALNDDEFRQRYRSTPLWRPRREGLLRNALIVAANAGRTDVAPAALALLEDPSPTLREAASWYLAESAWTAGVQKLELASSRETVDWVATAMGEDLARLAQVEKA